MNKQHHIIHLIYLIFIFVSNHAFHQQQPMELSTKTILLLKYIKVWLEEQSTRNLNPNKQLPVFEIIVLNFAEVKTKIMGLFSIVKMLSTIIPCWKGKTMDRTLTHKSFLYHSFGLLFINYYFKKYYLKIRM